MAVRATATVRRPLGDDALFLSQQPYVPLGSLRTALAYPGPAGGRSTTSGPPRCCARCSSRTSSTGSTRRPTGPAACPPASSSGSASPACCSPARGWSFLDEATSALDEGLEHTLYTLLREELPETVIVSVGHRSTLNRFHAERLELLGEGRWQVAALSH